MRGLLGMAAGTLALLASVVCLFEYLTDITSFGYDPRASRGWTSLTLTILSFAAVLRFGIGILGEYIGRLFKETKRRPPYLVEAMINLPDQAPSHPGERRSRSPVDPSGTA